VPEVVVVAELEEEEGVLVVAELEEEEEGVLVVAGVEEEEEGVLVVAELEEEEEGIPVVAELEGSTVVASGSEERSPNVVNSGNSVSFVSALLPGSTNSIIKSPSIIG
jgi:hypothetical protein